MEELARNLEVLLARDREGERMARHFLERAEEAGARRLAIFGLGVHTRPPEALRRRAAENFGIDHSHVTEGERA